MTEEICGKCGKPLIECECGTHVPKTKEEQEADRRIEIIHKGLHKEGVPKEVYEKEKAKREEYEAIIQLQAEKAFDEEKEKLLSQVDEEYREEVEKMIGDNPDELEKLKSIAKWTKILSSAVEQSGGKVTGRKPSGKATIPSPTKGERGAKEWIDNLYRIARDPSKTQAEKDEANRMLDEMFMEMIKGLNVAKRKTGRRLADWQTWECPQCKKQILQPRGITPDSCPNCSWKLYQREAVVTQ